LPEQGNPAQFKSALVFAALYAVVLLAVALAKAYFGNRGLYVVGVISGLTDMDAITLSTAQLANQSKVGHTTAWKVILLAGLANLLFKAVRWRRSGAGRCWGGSRCGSGSRWRGAPRSC
jgi:uncharacterized membrane protein (DUF4010 family)